MRLLYSCCITCFQPYNLNKTCYLIKIVSGGYANLLLTKMESSYLIKELLEKGHTVRTTVRDPENVEKVSYLWELKGAKERLKIMKANLLLEGSFDQAIQGVDGVFHTASPVLVPYDDNIKACETNKYEQQECCNILNFFLSLLQETLVDPCINGTLNVLRSCNKSGSRLKRVVLTSSCSAIRYRYDAEEISPMNESHWTDPDYCQRYNLWYAYAKTVAEQDAWKLVEENGIDLVVVNPSFIVGPLLAAQPTSTLLMILAIIDGALGEFPNTRLGFVHIDDVVAAHMLAMEEKRASGRLICSNSVAHWSEIIEMLRTKYPNYSYANK
ncbi:dehydratase [Lithospermum erythrorhizon]|uniref:Dihydroflavonol 4-reductase n=1 Tax=Lithospermum erythrorhizon TaxID=34254 RepID=A0AAV3RAB0_LITER